MPSCLREGQRNTPKHYIANHKTNCFHCLLRLWKMCESKIVMAYCVVLCNPWLPIAWQIMLRSKNCFAQTPACTNTINYVYVPDNVNLHGLHLVAVSHYDMIHDTKSCQDILKLCLVTYLDKISSAFTRTNNYHC